MNFSDLMSSMQPTDTGYQFLITDDWGQGRTAFGGIQGAVAVRAMRKLIDADIPLRSLQVTFIGPVVFEPGEVKAEVLRQGKSASQVKAEIIQNGKTSLIAIGIFGRDRPSEICDIPAAPHCDVRVEDAVEFSGVSDNKPAFIDHFISRIAKPLPVFTCAKQPKASTYSKHRDTAPLTEEHLVAIGDIAPPVALAALSKFAPASSMNWQLEIVKSPEQLKDNEWLRVDAEMIGGEHGYTWQNTNFWDEKGELVMLSRQCVAVFG